MVIKLDKDNLKKLAIPNFLGIGAPKCGTTWLSEVLRAHPDIFVAHGKELVYFSSEKKFSKGEQWYLDFFSDATQKSVAGEISVSYMSGGKKAAERIYNFNKDMKLIAILRDPVLRAHSHYTWLMQLGRVKSTSFLEALNVEKNIVTDGCYFKNLEPYLALFSRENFLILKFEDVIKNAEEYQRRIFEFLGVDANFDSGLTKKVIGKTINPRIRILEEVRIKLHKISRKNKFSFIISMAKQSGLSSLYRKLNNRGIEAITKEEYLKAVPYFSDDVRRLSEHVLFDFSNWLKWEDGERENGNHPLFNGDRK